MGMSVRVKHETDPLGEILRGGTERQGWGLDMMGLPLITYNLKRLMKAGRGFETVYLPASLLSAEEHLRKELPGVDFKVDPDGSSHDDSPTELPSNGLVLADGGAGFRVNRIEKPWDLLDATAATLREEVTETKISSDAEVARTAIISGPVVISEGALVDDFCKIKGPAYIGPRTRVWTGSLVRESMIGPDCEVGFACEIGRTYMLGGDRIAHHDVILDSILGYGTWMGAFIGTTNKLLNNANVKYKAGDELVDTGLRHFGAVFGHDSAIGAGTIILPGRFVPPNSILQAGTVYTGPADARR